MQGLKQNFQQTVFTYYRSHGRHDLPWRQPEADGSLDPYKILVSEVMLQQTQVQRVIPKYKVFLSQFPKLGMLSNAGLGEVLIAWQGLGYNRRAKFLWQAARLVAGDYNGVLPRTVTELTHLPGIGVNTAGAIVAYAYNMPAVFIETNIRTAFIYHFFPGQSNVSDRAIASLAAQMMPGIEPVERSEISAAGVNASPNVRAWYWALMDYGAYIKLTVGNAAKASQSYSKQPPFIGSKRQLRGQALRAVVAGPIPKPRLLAALSNVHAELVLQQLEAEGLLLYRNGFYSLP